MGVPAFYRWLVDKYPMVVVNVIEEEAVEIEGIKIPVDTSQTNPNKIEYDNLYLDMNGIIHPCFHPEDRPPPETFDEVFQCMFDYIDRLFVMVRPRKLLYMAVDGVAPRAKMNQQRSRRFRAAKDAADAAAEEERLREEFEREGRKLPPKQNSQVCDSNIITPGTEFMAVLSSALQYYIHLRLNNDPGWRSIKVILSNANVPGEGEHKIMSYIRLQRNIPGYDPNTRHCLYGLDADLIMLALATHEVHFSILREIVFTPGQDINFLCGQMRHLAADCEGIVAKIKAGEFDKKGDEALVAKKPYQFLNIWILREYLEYEFRIPNPPFEIDFECILDDFIFMCFFVGNDFLPHMPTLDIHEGAINLLMAIYKKEFQELGGYLTDSCMLNLSRVRHFIQAVGAYEDRIFQKRAHLRQRQAERIKREMVLTMRGDDAEPEVEPESFVPVATFHGSRLASAPAPPYQNTGSTNSFVSSAFDARSQKSETSDSRRASFRAQKVACVSSGASLGATIVEAENSLEIEIRENKKDLNAMLKEKLREKADVFKSENPEQDKVKLGEAGWKERYYAVKFAAKTSEECEAIRKDVVLRYTEGLCWVMHYYYEGVCSWQWFYPYHYAPFASDLKDLARLNINFKLGSPFKPFNQLLGVLPPASSHALPEHYRKLMTDTNSPLIDFYPTDFKVDMNGKRYAWQGVAKLPFIDEARLLAAVEKIEHTLTEEEAQRNSVMFDMLFVSLSNLLSPYIFSLDAHCKQLTERERAEVKEQLDPKASGAMNGYISLCSGDSCPPIFRCPVSGMDDIMDNQVICAIYRLPDPHKHITRPPPGVVFPERRVTMGDLKPEAALWHEDAGRKPWEHGRQNPPGSISGRQLGDSAHRLVANSLQIKADRNGYEDQLHGPGPFYAAPSYGRPVTASRNGYYNQQQYGVMPCRTDYRSQNHPRFSHNLSVQDTYNRGQGRPYGSSAPGYHPRPRFSHNSSVQDPHNRGQGRPYGSSAPGHHPFDGGLSYSQHGKSNRPMPNSGGHYAQGYYQPVPHQNVAPRSPHGHVPQAHVRLGSHHPRLGAYGGHGGYHSYGANGHQHQYGGNRPRQPNQNINRGYDHPRQPGNQLSALDRSSRWPPQSHGYGASFYPAS